MLLLFRYHLTPTNIEVLLVLIQAPMTFGYRLLRGDTMFHIPNRINFDDLSSALIVVLNTLNILTIDISSCDKQL